MSTAAGYMLAQLNAEAEISALRTRCLAAEAECDRLAARVAVVEADADRYKEACAALDEIGHTYQPADAIRDLEADRHGLAEECERLRGLVESERGAAFEYGFASGALTDEHWTRAYMRWVARRPALAAPDSKPAKPATAPEDARVCGGCDGTGTRPCNGCPHDGERDAQGDCWAKCPPCPACGGSGVGK